jgi:hypothetical protein
MNKTMLARFVARGRQTVPGPAIVLCGSIIWGGLMSGAAMSSIWLQNGALTPYRMALASLFLYGGALAFAPALWLSRILFSHQRVTVRAFGSAIVIFGVTHLVTAGVFALQYRVFYSHWHSNFPDITWFFQLAFTSAGAVYQYSVTSLYIYWPFALLAYLGFGLWFARSNRRIAH